MRKVLIFILVFSLLLSIAACSQPTLPATDDFTSSSSESVSASGTVSEVPDESSMEAEPQDTTSSTSETSSSALIWNTSPTSVEDAQFIIEQVIPYAYKLEQKISAGGFNKDFTVRSGDFYLVNDYDSYQAFVEDISSHFTTEFVDYLFKNYFEDNTNGPQIFKDIDGKLYSLDANRGGNYAEWETDTARNITFTEDSIEAEMISYRDFGDMSYYKIKLVKQDGYWVVGKDIVPGIRPGL